MNLESILNRQKLVGIVTRNSVSYINSIFKAFDEGLAVVPLRNRLDEERVTATGLKNIIEVEPGGGWFAPQFPNNQSDAIALISFTSGTEGAPKGVLLSFRALNDTVQRLLQVCAVDSSISEYICVPVYHSFGFGRCRLIAQVGGKAFLPEGGFDPKQIAKMLANGEINSLSAVPSMLRVLLENRELFASSGGSLRWLEIGSQPMSAEEKLALRDLFPQAAIVQHYGLTEASRTTLLRIDQASSVELPSVGKAYGSTDVSLSGNGKILIKGSHLASGLLIKGTLQPLPGEDGWFETNDLGRMENGYLFFEGRADNVINCAGQKISAELIEELLRKRFDIASGIAVTRIEDAIYGEAILVAKDSTCSTGADVLRDATQEIAKANGVHASGVVKIFECKKLPATDTGKVQHRLLRDLYNDLLASESHTDSLQNGGDSDLQKLLFLYQRVAGNGVVVREDDDFDGLGLDSISAVRLGMEVEKVIGSLPRDWRKTPIRYLGDGKLNFSDRNNNVDSLQRVVAPQEKGTTNENPSDIGFWSLIKEDFRTHESDWFSQGFWAVANHRFGNWRMGIQSKIARAPMTIIYRFHRKLVQIFCGIKLDYTVRLGRRVKLEHFGGMILGAKSIGDDVVIRQNTTIGVRDLSDLVNKPVIEQGVNIGTGAVIVGNITVGRYSVIGPNAVVDKNIPPFSYVSAAASIIVPSDDGQQGQLS
jgi:acyl-coenzyme A synthetase/AMP-(fatty) acid ligase/serine acetyltransferase